MSATAVAAVPVRNARNAPPDWWRFLRRELAPTPGRSARTLQVITAIVLVQFLAMTLRIPQASVSCFLELFLVKENSVTSLLGAVLIAVAFIVIVPVTIVLYRFTFDYPELRVPFMVLSLFVGMWFSRVCKLGPLAFAIGFVLAMTQSVVDGTPTADKSVTSMLWLLIVVGCPGFLVWAVGTVVMPISARNAVLASIDERLEMALAALHAAERAERPDRDQTLRQMDRATFGSAQMLKFLSSAEKEDPRWKARHADLTAAVTVTERIGVAAAALRMVAASSLSPADQSPAGQLTAEIAQLQRALRLRRAPGPSPAGLDTPAESARLRESQRAVADLRACVAGATPAGPAKPPKKKSGFFKPDAFTNPEHVRFALKVTLACMVCYFVFTGLDWSGTRTAFVTCAIIALETAGATMHKGTLRIAGCLGGALMGFLCLMYLIPHMTEITSLLLLSAVGASVGGWLSAGSDRIAYAGVQFNYAFFICIDQHYGPEVDFTSIRDRIIGILLGFTVSSVIYRFIWPDRATDKLRTVFARALRNIGRLVRRSPVDAAARPSRELYESVITDLAETQGLIESANFEEQDDGTAAALASAHPPAMVRHAQSVCLIAGQLLGRSQDDQWQTLGNSERSKDEGLRHAAADTLDRVTDFVEYGRRMSAPEAPEDHGLPQDADDRTRLRGRLLEECLLLAENCRAVERSRGLVRRSS